MNRFDDEQPIAPIIVDGREMTVDEFQAATNLRVNGSLYLVNTGVAALPEGLRVEHSLCLIGTSLTALPDGLHVGWWLDLRCSGITALPKDMHVGKTLYLDNINIIALPKSLYVGGSLYLDGTGIKPIGIDSRGHKFFSAHLANGPRVIAGCRNFSPAEARAHWPEGSECRELAERCIAALKASA
jgi:hypothetical protein